MMLHARRLGFWHMQHSPPRCEGQECLAKERWTLTGCGLKQSGIGYESGCRCRCANGCASSCASSCNTTKSTSLRDQYTEQSRDPKELAPVPHTLVTATHLSSLSAYWCPMLQAAGRLGAFMIM